MDRCEICGNIKIEVQHCTQCCAQRRMSGKWIWPWNVDNIPTDHEHKVFGGATV